MSLKSTYNKVKTFVQSIGQRIQGDNYGYGTNIGGTTVYTTGTSVTTTGSYTPSSSNGSSVSVSVSSPSTSTTSSSDSRSSGRKSTLLTPTEGATANYGSSSLDSNTRQAVTRSQLQNVNNLVQQNRLVQGTSQNYNVPTYNQQAYLPGTIYSVQTGEYEGTPVYQTRVVEPTGESRLATREEQLMLDPLTVEKVKEKTELQRVTGETIGKVKKEVGKEFEAGQYFVSEVQDWGSRGGKGRKITSEIISGIIPKTVGEVGATAVSFGIGTALGAATRGTSLFLSRVPATGKYLGKAFDIGTTTGGIYLTSRYALDTYNVVKTTGSYESIGKGIRELSVIGSGYSKGTKVADKWVKPFTNKVTLERTEPFRFERVETKMVNNEPVRVAEFIQFEEVTPIKLELTTTKFREKFKLKPLEIKATSQEFAQFRTIEKIPISTKKPFGVVEVRANRKYGTIYGVKGGTLGKKQIGDAELYKNLVESSKIGRISKEGNKIKYRTPVIEGFEGFKPNLAIDESLTLSKAVESIRFRITKQVTSQVGSKDKIKTTIYEDIKNIEPDKYDILYHGTSSTNLPAIAKKGLQPSRSTNNLVGLNDKPVVSLGGTRESVEGFASKSSLKFRMKGVESQPSVLRVKVEKGNYLEGEVKSGISNEYRVQEVTPENIPILSEEKGLPTTNFLKDVKKSKEKVLEEPTTNLPLSVGGKGNVISLYSGKGSYERTEEVSAILPRVQNIQENVKIDNINTNLNINKGNTNNLSIEKSVGKQKSKTKFIESIKEDTNVKSIELTKPISIVKQSTTQEQSLKDMQLLVNKLKQTTKPTATSINLPKIGIKEPKLTNLLKKKAPNNGEFEAVGFRFGKELSLGKFGEKSKASGELSKFLKETLGASGYLKSGKTKLKAEETGLLEEFGFRKSKRSPFLVVEEKTKRLRKGTTGKEIQFFR